MSTMPQVEVDSQIEDAVQKISVRLKAHGADAKDAVRAVETIMAAIVCTDGDPDFDQEFIAELLKDLPAILSDHFFHGDPRLHETTDGDGLLRGTSSSPYRVVENHPDGGSYDDWIIYEWMTEKMPKRFCAILMQCVHSGQLEERHATVAFGENRFGENR